MTKTTKKTNPPAQSRPMVLDKGEALQIFENALAIIANHYPEEFHTLYDRLAAHNKRAFEVFKGRTAALERMCIAAMARQVLLGKGKTQATRSMLFAYRDYMENVSRGGSPFEREIYQAILKDLDQ